MADVSLQLDEVTAFVGAGASAGAGIPAAVPLAEELLAGLVEYQPLRDKVLALVRAEGERHPRDRIRFEALLQEVQDLYDARLDVLSFLDSATEPSALHRQLAELAMDGARLLTVNFDDLLERAVRAAGLRPRTIDANAARRRVVRGTAVPVHKFHGTRLIHDGGGIWRSDAEPIATLTAIGAASPGTTLNGRAARLLSELVDQRILLLVGYSASDALDIVPALFDTRPARVVWVQYQHSPGTAKRDDEALDHASEQARRLADHWANEGISVERWLGDPVEVLTQRFGAARHSDPDSHLLWRERVQGWAAQSRRMPGHHRGRPLAVELLYDAGRMNEAHTELARLRLPHHVDGGWDALDVLLKRAETEFLREGGSNRTAEGQAREALEQAAQRKDRTRRAQALTLTGRIASMDPDRAEEAAQLLRLARKLSEPGSGIRADACTFLAQALRYTRNRGRARAVAEEGLAIYRDLGAFSGMCDAVYEVGLTRRHAWRFAEAEEALRESVTLAERLGHSHQLFSARAELGDLLVEVGRPREGLREVEQALCEARTESLLAGGDGWPAEGWAAALFIAEAHLELDDPTRAAMALHDALAQTEPTKRYLEPQLQTRLAHALILLGRRTEALAALDRAKQLDPALEEYSGRYWVARIGAGECERINELAERLFLERDAVSTYVEICSMITQLVPPVRRLRARVTRARPYAERAGNHTRVERIDRWLRALS